MPFYPRERGIILTALAKNGAVNAPLLSSPSQSWVPDPKIYKSSVELLFSSCSADFPLPLLSLNFYLCGREGDIFTMYFGLHQLSLCAWDVCLTITNQAVMNHTVFPCFVQTPQNVGQTLYKHYSRYSNLKFLTYLVFGHPNWIFLLFLNFVYYPWVPIVHGARRDYSWNNNVKCKVMFTLHRTDFRTARKSHPISYEHLSENVTLHFRDRRSTASLRYRNQAEITVPMSALSSMVFVPAHVWTQPKTLQNPFLALKSIKAQRTKRQIIIQQFFLSLFVVLLLTKMT